MCVPSSFPRHAHRSTLRSRPQSHPAPGTDQGSVHPPLSGRPHRPLGGDPQEGRPRAQGTRTGTAMTRMLEARASCRTAPHLVGSGGAAAEPPARPTPGLAPAPAPAPRWGRREAAAEGAARALRPRPRGRRARHSLAQNGGRPAHLGSPPPEVLSSPPHRTAPHSPGPPAARASSAAPGPAHSPQPRRRGPRRRSANE